jgi:hypothetical protein
VKVGRIVFIVVKRYNNSVKPTYFWHNQFYLNFEKIQIVNLIQIFYFRFSTITPHGRRPTERLGLRVPTAWFWKVGCGLARIVAVAHSNARNCLLYRSWIEIPRRPSDAVPVCEDYKRIAGSSPIFEKFCSRSKSLLFFFSLSIRMFREYENMPLRQFESANVNLLFSYDLFPKPHNLAE